MPRRRAISRSDTPWALSTWICIHCSFWSIASLCAQKADCTERWLRFTSREVAHYYFAPNNAKVESFNGRFRQECLNAHWFLSLADAQSKIDDWRTYYNEVRPHSALQWMTPAEFARQARKSASPDHSTTPEISTSDRD